MRRRDLLFGTFLFLMVFIGYGQIGAPEKPLSRAEDYQLKGKIKTYKLTPYHVVDSFGIVKKDKHPEFWKGDILSVFNDKGYKVESEMYDKHNKLRGKIIYKYDNKNKRLSRDIYNEYGHITGKYLYVYDEKGYKTAYRCYNPKGEIVESWLYNNDDKGREIEVMHQTPKRSPEMQKYAYKYDNSGNLIELTKFSKNNTPEITWKYVYDKKGQIAELHTFKGENLFRKKVTSYDAYNNPIKSQEYDGNGLFIEETNYQYKLDSHGNWTQRIDYVNGFPKMMYEREITYY